MISRSSRRDLPIVAGLLHRRVLHFTIIKGNSIRRRYNTTSVWRGGAPGLARRPSHFFHVTLNAHNIIVITRCYVCARAKKHHACLIAASTNLSMFSVLTTVLYTRVKMRYAKMFLRYTTVYTSTVVFSVSPEKLFLTIVIESYCIKC